MSDITPIPRTTISPTLIPLEILSFYGVFRPDAWDRFFYNEVIYNGTTYS
jgi:hypothetical protein